ncbi:protein of unknown function [Petrocella atlantisensis]|uniref:Uncharacterized protein n=1 Tax=Petrocella atlantisensis TaxID=2173034 RepID=A0A3P7NXX5_9FIRM|nr:protein of unknown function [Petrocella atlantisensis]
MLIPSVLLNLCLRLKYIHVIVKGQSYLVELLHIFYVLVKLRFDSLTI